MQNTFSKQEVLAMRDTPLNANMCLASNVGISTPTGTSYDPACVNSSTSCWHYWRDVYYPTVIKESYPVYITERAQDKGKQAFEIIKVLKDKKLVTLAKVGDFIDLMDELIKIL